MGKPIDSDKLLEWLDDHEDALCRIDVRDLRDAIHSGELTPKRVYARAPEGCPQYLTPGKLYPTAPDPDGCVGFIITDDDGTKLLCNWKNCGHCNDNWERVEK